MTDTKLLRNRNRDLRPGVPKLHPTEFAPLPPKTESEVNLGNAATVSASSVSAWLAINELELPDSAVHEMADRLSDGGPVNAVTRMDAFHRAYTNAYGHTYADGSNTELALIFLRTNGHDELAASVQNVIDAASHRPDPEPFFDGSWDFPYPVESAAVQNGSVFDTVVLPDGAVFHRRRDGIRPYHPQAVRIQANRRLTKPEVEQIGSLVGYAMMASLGGETADEPEQDSPFSFVMGKEWSRFGFDDFEDALTNTIVNGSPERTTNNKGPGTKGTRLVDGIEDDTLTFEIYYDSVR